jgi:hypothetical protein
MPTIHLSCPDYIIGQVHRQGAPSPAEPELTRLGSYATIWLTGAAHYWPPFLLLSESREC